MQDKAALAARRRRKAAQGDDEMLSDADSDGDSDAAADFLAGEEEGGDGGIGADPGGWRVQMGGSICRCFCTSVAYRCWIAG